MKITNFLPLFTISVLFCSCVEFFSANQEKEVGPGRLYYDFSDHSARAEWSTIPAPADGLQVLLDPVIIPEKPQFVSLNLF